MNSRLQNQLNMVGACLTVAQSPDHKPAWEGKPPADFATDLATLSASHAAITANHALARSATGGAADAKATAEDSLESAAYTLARALAVHFKKSGDLDRRGKVDFTRSEIARLRDRDLADQSTAIRDLGTDAAAEPGAAGRGITPAAIAALTTAITAFKELLNTPRGQIVNRGTLLKELETDTAALLEDLRDLDDLVVQFESTASGLRFSQAWKRARIIVDAGHGPGEDDDTLRPPSPPPVP